MAVVVGHIYNRHPFVEWSAPITYEWLVFSMHKPKTFFSSTVLFKPFPISVWIGFLVSVVLLVVTLKRISRLISNNNLSIPKCCYYILASILEQDSEYYLNIMRTCSARVVVCFWLLFALVLSTAYRGKLVALIAFPEMNWVPSTFEQLAYSNYRSGLNIIGKGGAAYAQLSSSKNPVYRRLIDRMEMYPDAAVCFREALQSNIGCIVWKGVAIISEARNFTDKHGRSPFMISQEITSLMEDAYVS